MAIVRAFKELDLAEIDLNFFNRSKSEVQFGNDVNTSFAGVVYSDLFTINGREGASDLVLLMLGGDFTVNAQKAITGGTVNALAKGASNGGDVDWYAQGISISGVELYDAVLTATNADEIALIGTALAGDDQLILSPFADSASGFAGNDVITGGAGDDVLDGGDGIDIAAYAGIRESATVVQLEGGALQVTVADEGTDILHNFEGLRFGDKDYAVADLLDKVAPQAIGFAPQDGGITFASPADDLVITYSEAIRLGTGVIELRKGAADGEIVETFVAGSSARVTVSGADLVIDPTEDLEAGARYFLTMAPGAVQDLARNAAADMGGYEFSFIPASDQWQFFTADGYVGEIGGSGVVYGTNGFQDITVIDHEGAVTLDGSFNRGGDTLRLDGGASTWTVGLSGSSAIFSDGDTFVLVPIGTAGLSVAFSDGVRSLRYDTTELAVKIGGQTISEVPADILAPPDGTRLVSGGQSDAKATLLLAAGSDVAVGGKVDIFGTVENQNVELTYGSFILDASFNRGGDTLAIDFGKHEFTGKLSGSQLLLDSPDLEALIPIGLTPMPVSFNETTALLRFDVGIGAVLLGTQEIGTSATPLTFA